jgi:two-component system CheB/CheR fusion protein
MRDEAFTFPIVGIGASAGGLEALRDFVGAIPAESGMAYVIVQHLAADHPSIMDQLLAGHSDIPVRRIEDGITVEPDTIYVIPAGPSVTIRNGRLWLHERSTEKVLRTPIDEFLTSLAQERGRDAFAVILSGTGSDGTLGVRAIKAEGGFAIVQKSESARFPGMPDSAAATGLVDFILTPRAIPSRLLDIAKHRYEIETGAGQEQVRDQIEASLDRILALIDAEDGHDFSEYKSGTLIRRIERRMTLLRHRDVDAFIERLKASADERARLLQDFLIGVTRFFRDEDFFLTLRQEAILPLLDRDQERFRIWVPGCSTGEEVYSIAMMVTEVMEAAGDARPCQIFGTDIDAAALTHARSGGYTESQLEGVSQERRERFFVKNEAGYQVNARLRERCVFAPHNLLQDPPFSRLDVISCRNLLIYLTAKVQAAIIPRFHYALNPMGFLFLGPSESLGKEDRYFRVLDREARLFQRDDDQPPGYSTLAMSRRDKIRRERWFPGSHGQRRADPPQMDAEQQITSFFLRESAPPFAMVNAQDEVSYLSERMGQYVMPAMGTVSASLDQFLARELRLPVRSAISEAREGGTTARVRNIVVNEDGRPKLVDLEARPVPFAEGSVLITLQPVRAQDIGSLAETAGRRDRAERDMVERELTLTRQQLTMTLSDYETTEQELRSSNEELLSMNEELQSSNEELETSREELQSINEELETINAELTENNRQLIESNSDLKNLFESTDIATVFLDQNLRVRRYTPAARRLFGIQDRDLGRNLSDLKWHIAYDTLDEDVATVTGTLQPLEQEVRIEATDETFVMRIRPYRRTDDRLDGCVISLFDITARKRAEKQLAENAEVLARQYAELETLYDSIPVGLNLLDRDLRYIRINKRLAEINGFPVPEHIGKRQDELLPDIDHRVRDLQVQVLKTGEPRLGVEVQGTTPAEPDKTRDWVVDFYPVMRDGSVFAVGSAVQDVTTQKELQRKLERSLEDLEESEARLEFALETGQLGAWQLDVETMKATERTELHDRIFGFQEPRPEWTFEMFLERVVPEDRKAVEERFTRAVDNRTHWEFECRINRADGELRWISAHGRPVLDGNGEVARLLGTVKDITETRMAEEQQSLLLHELQHRVKNTLATTLAIVQFSSERAEDVPSFVRTLRARLEAIARSHDILTADNWSGARLEKIVELELQPYTDPKGQRAKFIGDDVPLNPKQMLSLALAFHELATNAAKYGALSREGGTVTVRSRRRADDVVEIHWEEEGGPMVPDPDQTRSGFGTFLLERVLGIDLEGEARIEYHPTGVTCWITFPIDPTHGKAG